MADENDNASRSTWAERFVRRNRPRRPSRGEFLTNRKLDSAAQRSENDLSRLLRIPTTPGAKSKREVSKAQYPHLREYMSAEERKASPDNRWLPFERFKRWRSATPTERRQTRRYRKDLKAVRKRERAQRSSVHRWQQKVSNDSLALGSWMLGEVMWLYAMWTEVVLSWRYLKSNLMIIPENLKWHVFGGKKKANQQALQERTRRQNVDYERSMTRKWVKENRREFVEYVKTVNDRLGDWAEKTNNEKELLDRKRYENMMASFVGDPRVRADETRDAAARVRADSSTELSAEDHTVVENGVRRLEARAEEIREMGPMTRAQILKESLDHLGQDLFEQVTGTPATNAQDEITFELSPYRDDGTDIDVLGHEPVFVEKKMSKENARLLAGLEVVAKRSAIDRVDNDQVAGRATSDLSRGTLAPQVAKADIVTATAVGWMSAKSSLPYPSENAAQLYRAEDAARELGGEVRAAEYARDEQTASISNLDSYLAAGEAAMNPAESSTDGLAGERSGPEASMPEHSGPENNATARAQSASSRAGAFTGQALSVMGGGEAKVPPGSASRLADDARRRRKPRPKRGDRGIDDEGRGLTR